MEQALTLGAAAGGAARRRDRVADLEALFEAEHRRLYLIARRMAGDPEEARDLVQDAFVRLAQRPALPDGASAEAWLVRTVVNLCRDRWRRLKVRADAVPALRGAASRAAPDPESAAVARATVESLLARLPPRRRAVLVLQVFEDATPAEIARLLGIAQVTVRWHLAAARRTLKALLAASPRPPDRSKERREGKRR